MVLAARVKPKRESDTATVHVKFESDQAMHARTCAGAEAELRASLPYEWVGLGPLCALVHMVCAIVMRYHGKLKASLTHLDTGEAAPLGAAWGVWGRDITVQRWK